VVRGFSNPCKSRPENPPADKATSTLIVKVIVSIDPRRIRASLEQSFSKPRPYGDGGRLRQLSTCHAQPTVDPEIFSHRHDQSVLNKRVRFFLFSFAGAKMLVFMFAVSVLLAILIVGSLAPAQHHSRYHRRTVFVRPAFRGTSATFPHCFPGAQVANRGGLTIARVPDMSYHACPITGLGMHWTYVAAVSRAPDCTTTHSRPAQIDSHFPGR